MWLNRTLCSVLEEMRTCYKTRNFAPLLGLIEEAQSMGNRMEAALDNIKDAEEINEDFPRMVSEYNKLKRDISRLKKEKESLDEKKDSRGGGQRR